MRTWRWHRFAMMALALALTSGMISAEGPTPQASVTPAEAEPLQDACEPDVQEAAEVPQVTDPSLPVLDLGLEMDAVCSPPPECFQDRDCNRICGKNNGTCYRVNSCYRQCICNAA